METFRSMKAIALINFQRWKRDYRIWLIFAFTAILIVEYLKGYTIYGMEEGKKLTFCLLPLLYIPTEVSLRAPKILWHVGFLLLLCDAPFMHQTAPYMILRSQRKRWWKGECLYIISVAFIYMSFITLVSSLVALPAVSLENDWGPAITDIIFGTDSQTVEEILNSYTIGIFAPEEVIKYLYPFASEGYTFLTGWGTFCVLGLLLYFVRIIQKSVLVGLGITGVFIFLDPILTILAEPDKYWLQVFSPVCWTSLDLLNVLSSKHFLSIPFLLIMYPVLIISILFLIKWRSRKVIIEVKVL